MFVKAAKISDIPPGKLIHVELNGKEIVLTNVDGTFYAFTRRCGHMCAPLDMGTLRGKTIICPMHFAEFDVTSGKKTKEPLPNKPAAGATPEALKAFERMQLLRANIRTYDLPTFAVKVEGEDVLVDA